MAVPVSAGLQLLSTRKRESEGSKVVAVITIESQPSCPVRFCITVPVSKGLQDCKSKIVVSASQTTLHGPGGTTKSVVLQPGLSWSVMVRLKLPWLIRKGPRSTS